MDGLSKTTIAFILLGGLWGWMMDMGGFILAAMLAGLWLGNAVTGILEGRIVNFMGLATPFDPEPTEKSEEPLSYWGAILFHLILGGMVVVYCIREFH